MPDGQQQFLYASTLAANSATGPAAGATVVSQAIPAGLYDVEVWIGMSGTAVVAADSNNMKVSFGSTDLIKFLPCTVTTAGTTNSNGPFKFRLFGDGSTLMAVKAVGTSTGTAVYAASLHATRIGP